MGYKKPLTIDPADILEKIRNFCSYRERSEKEAEIKLKLLKVPSARIRDILQQLREEGFLSDDRFARAFVRGKWRVNHWGKTRITFELRSKRMPEKLISTALEEINQDVYMEILREMLRKKRSELDSQRERVNKSKKTLNIRDKLFNFALGKGYESDLIREILEELNI